MPLLLSAHTLGCPAVLVDPGPLHPRRRSSERQLPAAVAAIAACTSITATVASAIATVTAAATVVTTESFAALQLRMGRHPKAVGRVP